MIFKQNTFYQIDFNDIVRISYFQNDIFYEICWWKNCSKPNIKCRMLYTYTIEEILLKTENLLEMSHEKVKELVGEKNIETGFKLQNLNYISEKIENLIIKLEDYAKS